MLEFELEVKACPLAKHVKSKKYFIRLVVRKFTF